MKVYSRQSEVPFNALPENSTIHPVPNSSIDTPIHYPGRTMPFADQLGNYQRNKGIPKKDYTKSKVYIVGSGIAGLSAAYYFIRDGQIPATNIIFLEQLPIEGGSLDGAGNEKEGYLIRGGREMDTTYDNVWDIFQDIPALELPSPYSVLDEYRLLNDYDPNYSKARLIHNQGEIKDFSKLGLTKKDQVALVKLLLKKKEDLDNLSIEDYFHSSFFESHFWILWRTMFAFQNWHSLLEFKLYLHRFIHAIDGLKDLSALLFSKYNQYDTFVVPLRKYLKQKGVKFQFNTVVTDIELQTKEKDFTVKSIYFQRLGEKHKIEIQTTDFVIITTGSMTEGTTYGTNTTSPQTSLNGSIKENTPGWALWKNLACFSPIFGNPNKFCSFIDQSAWESATLTCRPSALTEKLKTYAINDPYSGKTVTGGIITITDSNWLLSFTCNRQPHFPQQSKDILVLWIYALIMNKEGNYIQKTMPTCTGNEILTELCYHLGLIEHLEDILANTLVRTAYMPYITSMFLPRSKGDRPEIVPSGSSNLGLVGQFVETPNDVVFTMESAVRTGRQAVYQLLFLNKQIPDIFPSQYDIRHVIKAAYTLNDNHPFMGESFLRKFLKGTYYEHLLPHLAEETKSMDSLVDEQLEKVKAWIKKIVH